jgi:hypothetical protein
MLSLINLIVEELLNEGFTSDEYHPDIQVDPMHHLSYNTDPYEQEKTHKYLADYFPHEDPTTLFLHGTNNMFLPHRMRRTTPELARAGDPQSFLAPGFTNLLSVAKRYASEPNRGRILVAKIHKGSPLLFGDPDSNPQDSYNRLGRVIRGIETPAWPEPRGGVSLSKTFHPNPINNEEFERHFNSLDRMGRHQALLSQARMFAKTMSGKGFDTAIHAFPRGGAGTVVQPLLLKRAHIIGEIPSHDVPEADNDY